mgnify:CR=1 FL=1
MGVENHFELPFRTPPIYVSLHPSGELMPTRELKSETQQEAKRPNGLRSVVAGEETLGVD